MDTEKGEVDAEAREVAEENKQAEQELDALFSRKQHLQATATQLETEIQEVGRQTFMYFLDFAFLLIHTFANLHFLIFCSFLFLIALPCYAFCNKKMGK